MGYEKKAILIFGKSGSGKSYLARHLLRDRGRVLIYDRMHEYTEGVIFYADEKPRLAQFWQQCYQGNFRLIYRTMTIDKETRLKEIDLISHLVWAAGDMTLCIEEFSGYCSANYTPDKLGQIVLMGRHRNIELFGIQQRPYDLNPEIRSQVKEIYIFNTTEPGDIDYFRGLVGREVETMLPKLGQYQYLYWQDGSETLEVGKVT